MSYLECAYHNIFSKNKFRKIVLTVKTISKKKKKSFILPQRSIKILPIVYILYINFNIIFLLTIFLHIGMQI